MPIYCKIEGCEKRGFYNFIGISKEYYCGIHRQDGMVNIISKKCKTIGCNKIPSFNFEGLKPKYCVEHKEDAMIATETKNMCIYENCKKRAYYKSLNDTNPIYCFLHKDEGMISSHSKRKPCEFDNCERKPTYNFEGLSPRFCKEHKEDEMINVNKQKCNFEGCNIRRSYNFKGFPPKFCFTHKLPDMIDVRNTCCEYEDCDKQPSYNFEGCDKIKYCYNHKLDGMIDVRNRKNKCKSDLCQVIIRNNKYKDYCVRCFIYLFPDEPVTRNYKTKERAVVEFVLSEFPIEKYTWITDKKIADGCSRKRPDLLLDLGYQVIIIEVDEDKHIGYDNSCENQRIMELSQDVSHRPIVFIRFNPDGYIDENGMKIKSCWRINNKGICLIEKSKRKEWQERLITLKSQIEYWICCENKSERTIEIIQLYFDK